MILQKLEIAGLFPERALIRLKKAKIPLYNVKKVEKNRILFSIKRKHTENVFAIDQNLCYNAMGEVGYTLKKAGGNLVFHLIERIKNRIGLLIGALLFALICILSQNFILQIKIVGETSYKREVLQALERGNLNLYGVYTDENNSKI